MDLIKVTANQVKITKSYGVYEFPKESGMFGKFYVPLANFKGTPTATVEVFIKGA